MNATRINAIVEDCGLGKVVSIHKIEGLDGSFFETPGNTATNVFDLTLYVGALVKAEWNSRSCRWEIYGASAK